MVVCGVPPSPSPPPAATHTPTCASAHAPSSLISLYPMSSSRSCSFWCSLRPREMRTAPGGWVGRWVDEWVGEWAGWARRVGESLDGRVRKGARMWEGGCAQRSSGISRRHHSRWLQPQPPQHTPPSTHQPLPLRPPALPPPRAPSLPNPLPLTSSVRSVVLNITKSATARAPAPPPILHHPIFSTSTWRGRGRGRRGLMY